MLSHAGGAEIAGIEIGVLLVESLNLRIGEREPRLPAGAIGRMQVMPQTYAALRDHYGVPWFLAAGNAGREATGVPARRPRSRRRSAASRAHRGRAHEGFCRCCGVPRAMMMSTTCAQ